MAGQWPPGVFKQWPGDKVFPPNQLQCARHKRHGSFAAGPSVPLPAAPPAPPPQPWRGCGGSTCRTPSLPSMSGPRPGRAKPGVRIRCRVPGRAEARNPWACPTLFLRGAHRYLVQIRSNKAPPQVAGLPFGPSPTPFFLGESLISCGGSRYLLPFRCLSRLGMADGTALPLLFS